MTHSSDVTGHHDDFGIGKKTFGTYFSGFLLCLVLTFIPFFSVIYHVASFHGLLLILLVSAVLQFFVQVICFLRLNNQSEQGRTNVLSFIFTGIVLLVIIGGSIWIMTSLNYFMMN